MTKDEIRKLAENAMRAAAPPVGLFGLDDPCVFLPREVRDIAVSVGITLYRAALERAAETCKEVIDIDPTSLGYPDDFIGFSDGADECRCRILASIVTDDSAAATVSQPCL